MSDVGWQVLGPDGEVVSQGPKIELKGEGNEPPMGS
jgi:hypothetical protein